MNRLKIAQYIALGALALLIISGIMLANNINIGVTFFNLSLGAGMIAYVFGGLGTALKMAGKIAKWGWLIVPFPFDLITGTFAFFFAFLILLFFPIIPIRKAYKKSEL